MCSAARFASLSHSPPHGARPSTPHSFSPIPHSPPLFRPPASIPATPRDADPRPSASSRLSSSRCRCVAATAVMLGPSVYRQPEETILSCHVLRLAPPHRVVGLLCHPPHGCRCRTSPPRCHGQPCQDKALASCPLRVPFTQLAPLAGTHALLCACMHPPHATSVACTAAAWPPSLGISPPAFRAAPRHAKYIELTALRQAFVEHLSEPLRAPVC
jgi:hypothetical protein